jgi:hypothetical protein
VDTPTESAKELDSKKKKKKTVSAVAKQNAAKPEAVEEVDMGSIL